MPDDPAFYEQIPGWFWVIAAAVTFPIFKRLWDWVEKRLAKDEATLSSTLQSIDSRLATLEKRFIPDIGPLETRISKLEGELSALKSADLVHGGTLASLTTTLGRIEGSIHRMEVEQKEERTQLQQHREHVAADIRELQTVANIRGLRPREDHQPERRP